MQGPKMVSFLVEQIDDACSQRIFRAHDDKVDPFLFGETRRPSISPSVYIYALRQYPRSRRFRGRRR